MVACSRTAPPPTPPPTPTAPARLADTGLYDDFAARTIAEDVLPFSPQYPLWSDGARKRRWIRLPAGTAIDASDADRWRFPVGTELWKEFAFERAVETRYLRHVAEGQWLRVSYAWNADGTDAVLAPETGVAAATHSSPGVPYDIPSRSACAACHDGGAGPVLGFSALQLSPDRDPLAPHAEPPPAGALDLAQLVARGWLVHLPQRLVDAPPRIAASSATERAVIGYLHGNCSACHNPRGALASLDMTFQYPLAVAPLAAAPSLACTINQPSRFRPRPRSHDWQRIAPGDPDHSVLLQRVRSRNRITQMPPLGSRAVDTAAVALIEAWIRLRQGQSDPTDCPSQNVKEKN